MTPEEKRKLHDDIIASGQRRIHIGHQMTVTEDFDVAKISQRLTLLYPHSVSEVSE